MAEPNICTFPATTLPETGERMTMLTGSGVFDGKITCGGMPVGKVTAVGTNRPTLGR